MLEVDRVSKTYHRRGADVRAVDQISLTLTPGSFTALQGPSGSGKTTLLLIAGCLLAPDSGQVTLAGQNPYQLSPEKRSQFRAATVGFVFQQFHLVPYLTVLDNVLVPSIALGTERKAAEDRAQQLIERFGLTHRSGHTPNELSTGERQRAALARALLNQPQLLLADEPTGNLDSENASRVLDHLQEFVASGGAVLLATHDDQAADRASNVLHVRDGQLA